MMGPAGNSFDILQDEVTCQASPRRAAHTPLLHAPPRARDALSELPCGRTQSIGIRPLGCHKADGCEWAFKPSSPTAAPSSLPLDAHAKAKLPWRTSRHRRPPVEWETFEPLDAVIEETSFADASSVTAPSPAREPQRQAPVADLAWQAGRLTSLDTSADVESQIEKHLAGHFEWLLTCPAPTHADRRRRPAVSSDTHVYGCNILRHSHHWSACEHDGTAHHPTDSYALIATPLRDAALFPTAMDQSQVCLATWQPPQYPDGPLKAPDLVTVVKEVLSPSLSAASEASASLAHGSTPTGAVAVPRIEDSLEELDKLEDELEAVRAVALGRGLVGIDANVAPPWPETPSEEKPSTARKRASIPGQSLTVRLKPCQRVSPAVRRAASLSLRDKKPERPDGAATPRDKTACPRIATPKSAPKSQKPLTVPKFELPGDAVAKRLKEQREARQAQQAEAQSAAQVKPRTSRLLARPTFELPGEAISRRKREEREAKLRAEEEEERRRREFKARPARYSVGPATLPRDTVASRARQNRFSQEDTGAGAKSTRADKPVRAAATQSLGHHSLPTRGRNSMMVPVEDSSRTASTSSGGSTKRSSLAPGELEQQRLRGKEIFARDSILAKDRERDRRERESTARMARQQAAERSRIASREWADKRRAREAAAARQAGQGSPPRQSTAIKA